MHPTPSSQRLRVLIVPDKFKGTLTAAEAAEHIARGWSSTRPNDAVQRLPMSDGGDGFGAVMGGLFNAKTVSCQTLDAAGQTRLADWWWHAPSATAIVETAQVIGLALLPTGKFHPFELDTRGLAEVIRSVTASGARSLLMGIGGSATNDGGFGLALGLGWTFFDGQDQPITRWPELARLVRINPPEPEAPWTPVTVAVDVRNPLLGPTGASQIYGPQKGLREGDFAVAEAALGRLAEVMGERFGRDLAGMPGAGAAGGLGFGLMAFLDARLEPGFELFARSAGLRERIRAADLVISGEGSIDRSTLMGKGVGGVANLSRDCGVPCLGLAGVLGAGVDPAQPAPFAKVAAIAPALTSAAEARAEAGRWLEALAARTATSMG